MKFDLHVHTFFSSDSRIRPDQLARRCSELGIDIVAITDHDTVLGARKVEETGLVKVITGQEIQTKEGDIIGLFLHSRIAFNKHMTIYDGISEIQSQGGLVLAPHPFDKFRRSSIGKTVLESIAGYLDMVEIFNARNPRQNDNLLSAEFAQRHGILGYAGSDAHLLRELGNATMSLTLEDNIDNVKDEITKDPKIFLELCINANIHRKKSPLSVHFYTIAVKRVPLIKQIKSYITNKRRNMEIMNNEVNEEP